MHALQIAAIGGRDEKRHRTSLLRCGDLLLDTTYGLDISIGRNLSGPSEVTASQQRSLGDLVIDRQSEDQAGARTADLLSEVEGDVRVVAISGSQGDTDDWNVGLDGGLHGGHADVGLDLVADDHKPHFFTDAVRTYPLGHRFIVGCRNAID